MSTGTAAALQSVERQTRASRGSGADWHALSLFAPITLISAFLLFQTELIVAKYILPWFGGTPGVWNTCMMFYQSLLLVGYVYSHSLTARLSLKQQARFHLRTLGITLVALLIAVLRWGSPLTPSGSWKFVLGSSPVLHILLLLSFAIGLPFFLLSTTGPLMQHWFSRARPGTSPYRLYALSNLGSLLGLLGYPFLLEWLLPIRMQARLWTSLFAIFLFLCALQARALIRLGDKVSERTPRPDTVPIPPQRFALWCGLAACGSVMLLATTNLICQKISANPFLWVMPLCIYLLTFTICFENSRWYKRRVFFALYFVAIGLLAWTNSHPEADVDAIRQMSLYCLILFAVCMVCNGELERLKPAPHKATPFYLGIALGGALGGAFVVLVAPLVFPAFYEFHAGLLGAGVVILGALLTSSTGHIRGQRLGWARGGAVVAAIAAMCAIAFALCMEVKHGSRDVARLRNFFGTKRVYDKDGIRYMQHGAIAHGAQLLAAPSQMEPLLYYNRHTGIGMLLTNYRRMLGARESQPLRMGVLGLGAGDLAAYAKPGDSLRFYEIDPQVVQLSMAEQPAFTFLRHSRGTIEIAVGDARLSLETEAARGDLQKFDVLIMDAFQGDAPPIHLLTSEAIELYLRHLKGPESVIAVNISNRVLDLTPVLRALSAKWRLTFDLIGNLDGTVWVLLSRSDKILKDPAISRPFEFKDRPVLWTDDYSNLLDVLKR